MPSSLPSFRILSKRSAPAPVHAASWCSRMDLLAFIAATRADVEEGVAQMRVHRLGWQTYAATKVEDDGDDEEEEAEEQENIDPSVTPTPPPRPSSVSSLCWRPDGSALALAFRSGRLSLFSIERRCMVAEYEELLAAPVTCINWIDVAGGAPESRAKAIIQAHFLPHHHRADAIYSTTSNDGGQNGDVWADDVETFFDPLPNLDDVLETWQALAQPLYAANDRVAGQGGHKGSFMSRGHGGSVGGNPGAMKLAGVHNDAQESRTLSLLLLADAGGNVTIRAFGTLTILQLRMSSPSSNTSPSSSTHDESILSLDLCPLSGILSIVTRNLVSSHISLRTWSVSPLLNRASELLALTRTTQQMEELVKYIQKCIDKIADKWKAARRSFHNRLAGFDSILEELGADESDTDPSTEFLSALVSGVPSRAMCMFIERNLSSGPVSKSCEGVKEAMEEMRAILGLALPRACEELLYRCSVLHTYARCTDRFSMVGLHSDATQQLQESATGMVGLVRRTLDEAEAMGKRYEAFGKWFTAMVKLVNNEHSASDAPPAGDDEDVVIPTYGPFDTELVEEFIQWEFDAERNLIDELLTGLKKLPDTSPAFKYEKAIEESMCIPGLLPPTGAGVNDPCMGMSLTLRLKQFKQQYDLIIQEIPRTLSRHVVEIDCRQSSVESLLSPASSNIPLSLHLFSAPPLLPLPLLSIPGRVLTPCASLIGTPRTIALRNVFSSSGRGRHVDARMGHRLAFMWTQPIINANSPTTTSTQFVTIVKYQTATLEEGASAAIHHLTLCVPPRAVGDSSAASSISPSSPSSSSSSSPSSSPSLRLPSSQSQLVSIQFYDDQYLQLFVQYQSASATPSSSGDAVEMSPTISVSSKLWMLDLSECEAEWWTEIDASTVSETHSLTHAIMQQLGDGTASLFSLLPPPADASTSCVPWPIVASIPSRSRLFSDMLAGSSSLNGQRGVGAIVACRRHASSAASIPNATETASTRYGTVDAQRRLLTQPVCKSTRKIILLDLQDDPDEDEEEEDEGMNEEVEDEQPVDGQANTSALNGSSYSAPTGDTSMRDSRHSTPSYPRSARSSFGSAMRSSGGSGQGNGGGGSGRRRSRASGGGVHVASPMMLSILSSMSLLCLIALLTLCLVHAPTSVLGSMGDMDLRFRNCLNTCRSRCQQLETLIQQSTAGTNTNTPRPPIADPFQYLTQDKLSRVEWASHIRDDVDGDATIPKPLTWLERNIFGWDCASNCGYHCMHQTERLRAAAGQPIVKYYGKWPFRRVLGMQELFSSLFSVLNAIPHIFWFMQLRRLYGQVAKKRRENGYELVTNGDGSENGHKRSVSSSFSSPSLSLLRLWSLYSIVYCNTWLWSTVFHARDLLWTERLDYFCASIGISFSLCVALVRVFGIQSTKKRILLVFLPILSLLLAHIAYLQWIHFDYGWNMKVSLSVGMIHSLLWISFSIARWRDGYHWRQVAGTLLLWLAASLEVFDFPPFFQLLDAHAMWHGLTPPLAYMLYQWVRDDLAFQIKQEEEERNKQV